MPASQIERLRAIGQDREITFSCNIRRLFTHTESVVDSLAKCVRECKRVDEASRYCRWLEFAVLPLLDTQDDILKASSPVLKASALRRKVRDVLYDCGELFKQGRANPTYAQSDIAEISERLTKMESSLASLALPPAVV